MNKDVIYIDVEDDITAIIGKIKASSEKIVALVPPKRVGVLQSLVNLRLLDRMATTSHKKLVIITNNAALMGLTASAGIPTAKNLQTKPEIAEIAALSVDDEEDIIDGSNLPVGELEKTADKDVVSVQDKSVNAAIDTMDIDDKAVPVNALGAEAVRRAKGPKKSGIKVPNFNSFRKRLFLGVAGLLVIIAFIIWANVYAPHATIIITTKTNPAPISDAVTLSGTTPTDVSKGTIATVTQTLKKDVSVTFTPTGQQDLGAKATGTVTIKNCDSTTAFTIGANTNFTASSGEVFVNPKSVQVPGYTGSASACNQTGAGAGVANVDITASAAGPSYNIAATTYSIGGISSSAYITAKGTATSGGTTDVETVVSDTDIATATAALDALPTDTDKKALIAQFVNHEVVIDGSFTATRATPVSSPALNAKATGQATLTGTVTYTIIGIAKPDIELYLKDSINKQLVGTKDQRMYDDGIGNVTLGGYNLVDTTATVNITATGQIGPNISTSDVLKQAEGKKGGEVQGELTAITGVDTVQVNLSPFWVTTVPSDPNKVDVQFKLTNG